MKRSLTPTQAGEVWRAASALPATAREAFFAAVDGRLVGIRRPLTDDDVNAAVVSTLSDSQTIVTSCFLCDSASKEADMAKNYDDDDAWDEHGLLRDGKRTRVPLMFRDGTSDTQRAIAQDASARLYNDRRPGPVYSGDRSAAAKAYTDAAREAEQAWKMQPTEATKEDAASILPPTMDAAEGRRRKQASYDAMVRENCDAWRNPSPLPAATDAAPPPHRRNAAPLTPTFDVEEGRRRKREAYDRMCREDADAWKDPSR